MDNYTMYEFMQDLANRVKEKYNEIYLDGRRTKESVFLEYLKNPDNRNDYKLLTVLTAHQHLKEKLLNINNILDEITQYTTSEEDEEEEEEEEESEEDIIEEKPIIKTDDYEPEEDYINDDY